MLFSVRQKHQDLLTQLAVSVQGYLALDVIRRNNLELIKGVQRATTTTVSALRTAVIVAQALADQKLVLDQITALNTTTSNLIESTSEMLHQQSGQINEQAASATVELGKLQAAFDNIYATMDEIDTFKVAALDTMQKTVTALSTEIAKSQTYLDRVRANETQGAADRSTRVRSEVNGGSASGLMRLRRRSGGALPLVDLALDVDQLLRDVRRGIADALVVDRRPELGDEEVQESLGAELAERLVELLGEVPLDRADQGRASLG